MKISALAGSFYGKIPRNERYRRGIESRLVLQDHIFDLDINPRLRENLVRTCTYHSAGEGDDGFTAGARDAAGSEAGGIIGQVTDIGGSQANKDGDGENILHFEIV